MENLMFFEEQLHQNANTDGPDPSIGVINEIIRVISCPTFVLRQVASGMTFQP
jgi:hypothetical protein